MKEDQLIPRGWKIIPTLGSLVRSTHPRTVLNPTDTFEVFEIKCEFGKFYIRGKDTCFFESSMIYPIELDLG